MNTELKWEVVEHWLDIWERAERGDFDWSDDMPVGSEHCAYCRAFLNAHAISCNGCPVAERTGKKGCRGTPWEDVSDLEWIRMGHPDWDGPEFHDELIKAIEAEYVFLAEIALGENRR